MEKLFDSISKMYQMVPNIIVNCAGVLLTSKLIETTDEEFERTVNVNLKGSFNITRTGTRELVKRFNEANLKPLESYASIINISSISAKSAFPGNQCIYAATKAGLDAMSKVLAYELAEYKIRVNSVSPGPIRTPMNLVNPSSHLRTQMVFMKRMGEASEIAECCIFIASDKSSYITGSILDCDGGWN